MCKNTFASSPWSLLYHVGDKKAAEVWGVQWELQVQRQPQVCCPEAPAPACARPFPHQDGVLQLRQHSPGPLLVPLASLKGLLWWWILLFKRFVAGAFCFMVRSFAFSATSQLWALPQNNALSKCCGGSRLEPEHCSFIENDFVVIFILQLGLLENEGKKKDNCCTVSYVLLTEVSVCVLWFTDWKFYFIIEVKILLFFSEFQLFLQHKIWAFI